MANIVLEKSANTVEEAIELALKELDVTEDQVEIEILEEGSKSFLGLGKQKEAKVRIILYDYAIEIARDFLGELFEKMGIDTELEFTEEDELLKINVVTKSSGMIIGRRGETLDSLQFLTGLVVNRNNTTYRKIIIDTENYRKKREETLEELANRIAAKVEKSGRNKTLEPMNPYERRIIHSTLQKNKNVETFSVGEEPNRKVVIKSIAR
ncbi:MAG: protein jag [Clostridia bacterium]|nr:protein jag [Clostridia bacterium]MBN2883644.1 protein jag [Clostridia bacterium]